MSSASDELRVLDEEPGRFTFLAWRNITIMVWHALPDSADIARLMRMGTSRAAESRAGLSDVHFVSRRSPALHAPARRTSVQSASGFRGAVSGSAPFAAS